MAPSSPLPNATVSDLEEDFVFHTVLLESLDPESDDYEERRADYQATLDDLERRLHVLTSRPLNGSYPATPSRQDPGRAPLSPQSRSSLNLPSRDADRTAQAAGSPLQIKSAWQWPASMASPSQQKRARDSLQLPNDGHKRRKNDDTPSTSTSRASTPNSLDSLDRVDRSIERKQRANPVRYNVLARLQEEEKQRQARRDTEKADWEFARGLSTTDAISSHQPSFSSHQTAQAYFQPNGDFVRPPKQQPAPAVQRPQIPSFDQHGFAAQIKHEMDRPYKHRENDAFRSYSQQNGSFQQPASSAQETTLLDEDDEDEDDDDDDVQYLGTGPIGSSSASQTTNQAYRQWRENQNPQHPHRHTMPRPSWPSSTVPTTNAYGQSRHGQQISRSSVAGGSGVNNTTTDTLRAQPAYSSSSAANVYGANRFNPINVDLPTPPSFDLNTLSARTYDDLLSLMPGTFPSGNFYPEDLPKSYPSLESRLHSRGLEYMLNDPAKSREELEKLIENIRPDEDLPPEMRLNSPEELRVSLMEHQKLGLTWLQKQEDSSAKGGILADDMGLGKTIQALALIATRKSDDPARKTTLIVAPVALLRQWQREIEDRVHPRHKLSSMIYHGQAKSITFSKLSRFDIVITTFGKLASEVKRKWKFETRRETEPGATRRADETLVLLDEKSKFHRIIVDEAQNIKNHNAQSSLGALYVDATYRLCMTGTPMMNNVGELFSLIRFLRIPPYNQMENFNRTFKRPLEGLDERARDRAMKALQVLCKSIMLRRTKTSKIDGKPILVLPDRTTEVVHAVFDKEQEAFYRALEQQTQLQMNKWLQKGRSLKNYTYILVRLLRLRQACDHPQLIKDYSEPAYADISKVDMQELARQLTPAVIERIKDAEGAFECPICYDAVENPSIFFPCGHDCCPECFIKVTDQSRTDAGGGAKCPECRSPLDTKKIIDYRSFKKVHMPNDDGRDEIDELFGSKDEDDQSDSDESDSDSDEESEDSNGDMRDFIVKDEEDIEYDEPKSEDDLPDDGCLDGLEVNGTEPGTSTSLNDQSEPPKGKEKAEKPSKGKGKKPKKPKQDRVVRLAQLKKQSTRNLKAKEKYLKLLGKRFETSAKIDKVEEIIAQVAANDPTEKIIIFSQFTTFLDLLEIPISRRGYQYRRYDGSMSGKLRNDAVLDFQDRQKDVKIILVSLKAGNAGLNLTAASQVILLDPFWNPFIEEQAIDRAHRIGQTRPVQVHKVLIEDTVEDRIIALQEKKRELINTALDESASKNLARLGRAELRYLFGLDAQLEQ